MRKVDLAVELQILSYHEQRRAATSGEQSTARPFPPTAAAASAPRLAPVMSILVIGMNHRSGPVSVLERVALAERGGPKAVGRWCSRDNVREAVLISTCNRTEVYAVTERFHGAYADIRDFFCEVGGHLA